MASGVGTQRSPSSFPVPWGGSSQAVLKGSPFRFSLPGRIATNVLTQRRACPLKPGTDALQGSSKQPRRPLPPPCWKVTQGGRVAPEPHQSCNDGEAVSPTTSWRTPAGVS